MIKKLIVTLLSLPIILAMTTIVLIFVNPIINEFRLSNFAKQLKEYPLPDKTYIVDTQSACGKLNGNGNGMDFFACILIKSELDINQIKEHYSNAIINPVKKDKRHEVEIIVDFVTSSKVESDIIEHYDMFFEKIKEVNDYTGYYYVMVNDGGYSTGFDLRGH